MKMIILLLLAPLSTAEVIWKPSHNDPPVTPEIEAKIMSALPDKPIITPSKKHRILLFSATAGHRHASIPTGKFAFDKMGQNTGIYECLISDDLENFERSKLKTFDAVVMLNSTGYFFMPSLKRDKEKYTEEEWAWLKKRHDRLEQNLVQYVNDGGGLIGIHAATDACSHDSDYIDVIGGKFSGHPWSSTQESVINIEDPNHALNKPVFGDMTNFNLIEEIYQFKDGTCSRNKLRVLLSLDAEASETPKNEIRRSDGDFPVSWIQKVGTGRVFYTSIGHREDVYWNPLILNHYLSGIQFATGDLAADTTPSNQIQLPHLNP